MISDKHFKSKLFCYSVEESVIILKYPNHFLCNNIKINKILEKLQKIRQFYTKILVDTSAND